MLFYKQIDLPQIPVELLNFDQATQEYIPRFDYGKDHYVDGKIITPPSYFFSDVHNTLLNHWLLQHLPKVPKVNYSQLIPTNSRQMLVHTDIKRIAALNYLIDTGGDDVVTRWYQEQEHPVERQEKTVGNQTDTGYVDYQNLNLLDSTVFKKNCWYLVRTNVLHDATNISSTRRYLGVSYFEREDLEFFGF